MDKEGRRWDFEHRTKHGLRGGTFRSDVYRIDPDIMVQVVQISNSTTSLPERNFISDSSNRATNRVQQLGSLHKRKNWEFVEKMRSDESVVVVDRKYYTFHSYGSSVDHMDGVEMQNDGVEKFLPIRNVLESRMEDDDADGDQKKDKKKKNHARSESKKTESRRARKNREKRIESKDAERKARWKEGDIVVVVQDESGSEKSKHKEYKTGDRAYLQSEKKLRKKEMRQQLGKETSL